MGVARWCPNIVLGSPWPNGNAMAGPVRNFSSGAVQIQSRFPFLRAGVKKCNRQTLGAVVLQRAPNLAQKRSCPESEQRMLRSGF